SKNNNSTELKKAKGPSFDILKIGNKEIGKDIEKTIKEEPCCKNSKKKYIKIILEDFNSIRSNKLDRKDKEKAILAQN
ncbi:25172_t:CDS:2, partial [Gigaspora rosea]